MPRVAPIADDGAAVDAGEPQPAPAKSGGGQSRRQKEQLRKKRAERRHRAERSRQAATAESEATTASESSSTPQPPPPSVEPEVRRRDLPPVRPPPTLGESEVADPKPPTESEDLTRPASTGEPAATVVVTPKKLAPSRSARTVNAAAATIQRALKKKLPRYHSFGRHSCKVFAEDALAIAIELEPPSNQTQPADVTEATVSVAEPLGNQTVSEAHAASIVDDDDDVHEPSPMRLESRASSSSSCSSSCSCSSTSSSSEVEATASSGASKPRARSEMTSQDAMAVRIQARVRGVHGRQAARDRRDRADADLEAEARCEVEHDASVVIQANLRGFLARRQLDAELSTIAMPQDAAIAEAGDVEVAEWPQELNLEPQDAWTELGEAATPRGDRVTDVQFLSQGKLRVFCGTWNLHATKPAAEHLALWIPRNRYHLVAVGTEECVRSIAQSVVFPSKKVWELHLAQTLGDEYTLVASHALTAIHLAVFAHESVLPLVSRVQSDAVATGLGNQLGNKGGVGVSLCVGATSVVFVNCHLDAHQHNVDKRNANFHRINQELALFPPSDAASAPPSRKSVTGAISAVHRASIGASSSANSALRRVPVAERFDRVFWFGDLNYRINGTRRMVDLLLLSNQHAVLRFNDQLAAEMREGRVFRHFREGPLHFRPTYKFDKRSDVYDTSAKQRIPSWTDRVLFLSNDKPSDVDVLAYRSHMGFQSSDHRPVGAVFQVAFSPLGAAASSPPAAPPLDRGQEQPATEQTAHEFARVVARGYKGAESKSEVCSVQ